MAEYQYAILVSHIMPLPLGRRAEWYEWRGNKHALLKIDESVDISRIPFRLKFIEQSGNARSWNIYARTDGHYCISAWYWLLRTKTARAVQQIYYRTILTLMVWGLAYTSNYEVPSWKDIGRKP